MNTSEKSSKGGLSCAECRRSKLKCDRIFPCQACIRRGCGHLCPNGTLAATKGNKVLMAHAQRLAEQMKMAQARIKDLEDALKAQSGDSSHALLQQEPVTQAELLSLETIYDDGTHEVSDAIGSLAIGADGKARYYGETASSEYFQRLIDPPDEDPTWDIRNPKYLGMPFEIIELFDAFPLGLRDCPYNKSHFAVFLPPRERALELVDLYYRNVAWMYDPIVRSDLMKTVIGPIYGTTGYPSVDLIHSHRLAVFFVVLASGAIHDGHPSATILAQQYHALSRAALSLDSIIRDANSATVQALFMIIRFIHASDAKSGEERWLLGGVCAKVAQIIGLQRDSAGWNLEEEEVQRRRVLFWELYTYDAWSSVVAGRPPSLGIQYTDCHFPVDLDPFLKSSGTAEFGFHAWKFRYSACCLSISVQHVFSTKAPSYSALLELDKKLRQFVPSAHLQSPVQASEAGRSWSADPTRANQQYCVLCERESNLLLIHRSSFAQAIRVEPLNPLKHKFAPSVLATYRSACRLICGLKGLYSIHPELTSRQWFFWSAVFSACIVLGALVVESPGCSLARNALHEMEQAVPFYEVGSAPCRPSSTMGMLQKLLKRSQATFAAFRAGSPPNINSSSRNRSTEPDELEVLGGRKSVINTTSSSNSPVSNLSASGSSPLQPLTPVESSAIPAGTEHYDADSSLFDFYNMSGGVDPQTSGDFDMSPFVYGPSYGQPQGMSMGPQPSFNMRPSPEHDFLQPGVYRPTPVQDHQLSDQMDVTMLAGSNQDDIWRAFMSQLLPSPSPP